MGFVYLILGAVLGAASVWVARYVREPAARGVPTPPSEPAVPVVETVPAAVDADQLSLLRAALDALPIGVVYANASGEVVVRNRMAEHAGGARHGDVLVEEAVEGHLRAAARGRDRSQTLDLFGPPPRSLRIFARSVEGGGAIATITDVTERVRLDAVRTDFVANISHELRTPLGALLVLAETLADTTDAETVARLSAKLVKESERLNLMIDDLLELAQIELEADPTRERVLARTVLEEAVERVGGFADRRHVQLAVVARDESLAVLGDRRQLVSALGNLIENAVKYSERGSRVEITAAGDRDRVVFSVTDHGMGMAPQHLDRVFERFYRVDRARSRDTGGVGLGLAIVRHVAVNHGGDATVTSEEGEGSTFRLSIPADPDSIIAAGTAATGPGN